MLASVYLEPMTSACLPAAHSDREPVASAEFHRHPGSRRSAHSWFQDRIVRAVPLDLIALSHACAQRGSGDGQ
jgi:hypothetical protein